MNAFEGLALHVKVVFLSFDRLGKGCATMQVMDVSFTCQKDSGYQSFAFFGVAVLCTCLSESDAYSL